MPEKSEFLPFHAINEFMRPDFRLSVVRETLLSLADIPEAFSDALNHQIKKTVTIPGFRNSDKAPALIKVLPTSKAFEKNSDLVAALLSCWAEQHSSLRDQVYQLLIVQNWNMLNQSDGISLDNLSIELIKEWPVLPINVDRAKLPGFYTHWPKGQDFETIYQKYCELYPESVTSIDKVSLMAVWLTMRLPYHVDDFDEKQVNAD
jgi:hypothetical protein